MTLARLMMQLMTALPGVRLRDLASPWHHDTVTCHNLSQYYLLDKSGHIKVWSKGQLDLELIKFYQTQIYKDQLCSYCVDI